MSSTPRQLAPIKRRLRMLERTRVGLRADVTKLQVEVYELTSRIAALERAADEEARRRSAAIANPKRRTKW